MTISRLEELTERLGLVETLLADLDATVIAAGATGRIVYANINAAKMLGYSSVAEITAKQLTELMPDRYRRSHAAGWKMRVEDGTGKLLGKSIAVEALRADGSEISVLLWLQEQIIEGEKYYVGVLRDSALIMTLQTEEIKTLPEEGSGA